MKEIVRDEVAWDKIVKGFPQDIQDIYYIYRHFSICRFVEDGEPEAFYYEVGEKKFFYPYFINKIIGYELDNVYYDIQTPYGYGGPLTNTRDEAFLESAEHSFLQYCEEKHIVCEFVRFHPLLKNHDLFNRNIDIIQNRKTVFIDLNKSIEDIWCGSISSKNRNVIRKAEKGGLRVIRLKEVETFKSIYSETMLRINADKFYFFNDNYFNAMFNDERYIILGVEYDKNIIACGIFISSGQYFHYHLAGSKKEFLKFSPNNLMLYEAIKLGKELGKRQMFLGGGLRNSIEDPLFKFKASFSKESCDFYVGKRVHDRITYDYLISQWEKKNGRKSSILLQYRY
jgi:hypothetical protein